MNGLCGIVEALIEKANRMIFFLSVWNFVISACDFVIVADLLIYLPGNRFNVVFFKCFSKLDFFPYLPCIFEINYKLTIIL